MSEEKLTPTRLVFIPFLIITVTAIAVYSIGHWILHTYFNILETTSSVKFVLPFIAASVFVILFISPRLKLLNLYFKNTNENPYFIYGLGTLAAIGFSIMSLQDFICSSIGEMTVLSEISEIHHKKPTKYYSLKTQYIDYKHLSIHSFQEVRRKKSRTDKLAFNIYVTAPILNSAADTTLEKYEGWIARKYYYEIKNNETESFKVKAFDEFYNNSLQNFLKEPSEKITYLERMYEDKEYFERLARKTLKAKYPAIIFDAHYSPFPKRSQGGIELFVVVFTLSLVAFFLLIHNKSFNKKELDNFLKKPKDT